MSKLQRKSSCLRSSLPCQADHRGTRDQAAGTSQLFSASVDQAVPLPLSAPARPNPANYVRRALSHPPGAELIKRRIYSDRTNIWPYSSFTPQLPQRLANLPPPQPTTRKDSPRHCSFNLCPSASLGSEGDVPASLRTQQQNPQQHHLTTCWSRRPRSR